jgi:hypothetical protein
VEPGKFRAPLGFELAILCAFCVAAASSAPITFEIFARAELRRGAVALDPSDRKSPHVISGSSAKSLPIDALVAGHALPIALRRLFAPGAPRKSRGNLARRE